MDITPNTKIAELLKANDQALAAIAAMAKPFQKLKNPILRKLMASRISILDAAHIGKCTLADFEKTLSAIGFTCINFNNPNTLNFDSPPAWIAQLPNTRIVFLDVREDIAANNDPLKTILKQLRAMKADQVCCLITPFVPIPLIQLLQKKGFRSYVSPKGVDLFYTWIVDEQAEKTNNMSTEKQTTSTMLTMHNEQSFKAVLDYFSYLQIRYLDVSALPMPEPMQRILESLSTMVYSEALYVQHQRIPFHLLEELAYQDYKVHVFEARKNDVRLLIHHGEAALPEKL